MTNNNIPFAAKALAAAIEHFGVEDALPTATSNIDNALAFLLWDSVTDRRVWVGVAPGPCDDMHPWTLDVAEVREMLSEWGYGPNVECTHMACVDDPDEHHTNQQALECDLCSDEEA